MKHGKIHATLFMIFSGRHIVASSSTQFGNNAIQIEEPRYKISMLMSIGTWSFQH